MITNCPGGDVEITIVGCPKCGGEVELFTGDSKAKCFKCGTWAPREIASCIDWCPGAEECFKYVFEQEGRQKAGDNKNGDEKSNDDGSQGDS